MKEKKVTVDFIFIEDNHFDDKLPSRYVLDRMKLVGSGLTKGQFNAWAEDFLQSYYASVEFPVDLVESIEKEMN